MAFQVWYNVHYFGNPLRSQFELNGAALWSTPLAEGLAGLLFSPARGLFVYSPVFVFGLFGFVRSFRKGGDELVRALALGVLATVLFMSRWYRWWGGWTYGPRLLADLSPAFALGMWAAWPLVRECATARALFGATVLWSFFAHGLGAFAGNRSWNARPVSIDQSPERLWQWSDNQLVNSAAKLLGHPRHTTTDDARVAWNFAGEISLLSYKWRPLDARSFSFSYRWRAERVIAGNYAVFVRVDGPDDYRLQEDYWPGGPGHPTSSWAPGEIVSDTRVIELSAAAPAGTYMMRVGVWDPVTHRRLEIGRGWFRRPAVDLFAFRLGEAGVSYSTRQFRQSLD